MRPLSAYPLDSDRDVGPAPALLQAAALVPARLCKDDLRLASLLRDHFAMVWSALRRLGVPEANADDAAQDVFITAARKLDELEPGCERPYLYGIALRVAANARRAQRRRSHEIYDDTIAPVHGTEHGSSDQLLEEKRLRELLDDVLDRMPEPLRTVFVLFEFEGFTEREIAALCEIPVGTAASRIRRARSTFQRAVQRLKSRLREGAVR